MSAISDFTDTAQKLVQNVIAATSSIPESIKALIELAQYDKGKTVQGLGKDAVIMQEATHDVLRRITVIALVGQVAKYQPTSYDDAHQMKQIICDILDKEIITAADNGESNTYLVLRRLKSGIMTYLIQKGADLSRMTEVASPMSMPVSVWVNKLYQDTGRQDELINQANPPHPAFMPAQFKVLSK